LFFKLKGAAMRPSDHDVVPTLRACLRQWNLPDALRHYDLYALKATVIACAFNVTLVHRGFRRVCVSRCVTRDIDNPAVGFYESLGWAASLAVVRTGWQLLDNWYQECLISIADSTPSQALYQRTDADWQEGDPAAQVTLGGLFGYPKCCIDAFAQHRTTYQGFLKATQECPQHALIVRATHLSGCIPCRVDCPQALARGQEQWAVLQQAWGEPICSLETEVAHLTQEIDYRYFFCDENFSALDAYAQENWQRLLEKYHHAFATL
jgi:hypothetical protein